MFGIWSNLRLIKIKVFMEKGSLMLFTICISATMTFILEFIVDFLFLLGDKDCKCYKNKF